MLTPELSDSVIFVSALGRHAALVVADFAAAKEAIQDGQILNRPLDSEMHAHLYVFLPFGETPHSLEWNVPFSAEKKPYTWHWRNEDFNHVFA